jgi:branched-chain amino acid transport system substrate-binding protein
LADETPILHGLSAWVQHVNAAGGVNGRKIKLITADDGSDTSRGSAELRKLVEQDKVFALVAECGPLTDAQNFEYLKQKGVPVVGTCILPTKDFNTNPFQYPLRITPDSFGRIMAKYAVSDMGSKKPAVVYINQAPIDEMGNGAVQQWKAMGVNNYVVEQVSVVEPNYTPTVVDLRRQGVDNVTLLLDNASTIRFLQAASQQGWKPPMISLTAFDEQVIRYGGAEIEGTVAPFFMEPVRAGSNAATTQFRADMQRYYPSEPEIELALNGWFPGHVFTDMLARLGDNISRRALMQQLDSLTNYDTGIIPPFTERVGHHETRRAAKWGVIEGGKAVFHNKDWWFLYPDHS